MLHYTKCITLKHRSRAVRDKPYSTSWVSVKYSRSPLCPVSIEFNKSLMVPFPSQFYAIFFLQVSCETKGVGPRCPEVGGARVFDWLELFGTRPWAGSLVIFKRCRTRTGSSRLPSTHTGGQEWIVSIFFSCKGKKEKNTSTLLAPLDARHAGFSGLIVLTLTRI